MYHNAIPSLDHRRVLAPQIDNTFPFPTAIPFDPQVQPRSAIASLLHPRRSTAPPLGQDRTLDRDAEFNLSRDALAARPLSERELTEDARVALFEDFRVRDARVGHVCVHATAAVPRRSGAATARDGLVVAKSVDVATVGGLAPSPEGEVVAAALGGGTGLEGG